MKYKGRIITRTTYQGLSAYRVNGWFELAANLATVKRWIDIEIATRLARRARSAIRVPNALKTHGNGPRRHAKALDKRPVAVNI